MHIYVSLNVPNFYFVDLDNYPWSDIEISLNPKGDDFSSGYLYQLDLIESAQVNGLRFINSDGKSFNPWLEKPQKMIIHGKSLDGKKATEIKSW